MVKALALGLSLLFSALTVFAVPVTDTVARAELVPVRFDAGSFLNKDKRAGADFLTIEKRNTEAARVDATTFGNLLKKDTKRIDATSFGNLLKKDTEAVRFDAGSFGNVLKKKGVTDGTRFEAASFGEQL